MWTPFENAAQSGELRPPPIRVAPVAPTDRATAPRDPRRRFLQRPRRAPEGVDQAAPSLGHHLVGQVLEPGPQGERRQVVGQGRRDHRLGCSV